MTRSSIGFFGTRFCCGIAAGAFVIVGVLTDREVTDIVESPASD